ncbi:Ger(x)C family spore germination protein [Paenibacillus koleovorans]|uniref:Ger(x)C family spore germination protein n=1 Tax=Paenibacillus koleovorans TaxID=121608 RepID=UPI0013E30DE1|nr:Ger(x)C family spore germination protein [Paenibacillus koleovorans]
MHATMAVLLLAMLPGCWDLKEIVNRNYIASIGFDFVDNEYKVYVQLLDFSSIAKQASGKPVAPAQTWIGMAEGKTVIHALNNLYRSSQQQTDWDHVNSILLTERAMEQGIDQLLDGLFRFRSVRYTCWVFSTKMDIPELLGVNSFFNQSAIRTLLHSPHDLYAQRSYIRPIRYVDLVKSAKEPGQTARIPSLHMSEDTWLMNDKPDPKMSIDGLYAVRIGEKPVWFSEKQAAGVRWFEQKFDESPMILMKGTTTIGTVKLVRHTSRIQVDVENEEPVFHFLMRIRANLVELKEQLSEEELSKLTESLITKEIEATMTRAVERNTDLFQLEHQLFRQNNKLWKRLTDNGTKPLAISREQLRPHVQVQMQFEGRFWHLIQKQDNKG